MTYEPELKRNWNLFLDDSRESHTTDPTKFYHIARSTLTAKKLCVLFGPPQFMSLDSKLGKNEYGEEDSVMEFLTFLKDRYKCNPVPFQYHDEPSPEVTAFMGNWDTSIS